MIMSKYTTELRYICESEAGLIESAGYNSIDSILDAARVKIFSFPYDLFDSEYKPTLEKKILKHYYTREICAETYGRWKLFLESKMLEIMPYYNELYKTALMEYDIFDDVNYTRTGNRSGEETGTSSDSGTTTHSGTGTQESTTQMPKTGTYTNNGVNWQKYSDTPQGSVQNIDNDSYLTNATKTTEDGTQSVEELAQNIMQGENTDNYTDERENSGEHAKNTLETYVEVIKGKYPGKSYMNLIQEFRDIILNIDKMIIDDLADLFMMVY